jgi:hypothetical protein
MEYPHHDPEWLTEKYWEDEMSLNQMADEAGFTLRAVARQMEKYGIPRRGMADAQRVRQMRQPVPLLQNTHGHEQWKDATGQKSGWTEQRVNVHRLAALAWGIIDTWDDPREVHHENEIPWDNREENLTALTTGDHLGVHSPFR